MLLGLFNVKRRLFCERSTSDQCERHQMDSCGCSSRALRSGQTCARGARPSTNARVLSGLPQIQLCNQFVWFASSSMTRPSGNSVRRDGAIGGSNRTRKATELRQRPPFHQNRCLRPCPGRKQDTGSSSASGKGRNGQRGFRPKGLPSASAPGLGHGTHCQYAFYPSFGLVLCKQSCSFSNSGAHSGPHLICIVTFPHLSLSFTLALVSLLSRLKLPRPRFPFTTGRSTRRPHIVGRWTCDSGSLNCSTLMIERDAGNLSFRVSHSNRGHSDFISVT
jgi:hypothetical protein